METNKQFFLPKVCGKKVIRGKLVQNIPVVLNFLEVQKFNFMYDGFKIESLKRLLKVGTDIVDWLVVLKAGSICQFIPRKLGKL